ncbi:MAG: serine hydrolase, partial [Acidobacteriota bacterium]
LDATYTLTPADFSLGHSPIRDGAGGKAVTLTLRELVRAAVADSDNTAADYLLRMVKPPAVTERMRVLGTPGIRVDRTEKEIIQTFAKPGGVTRYAVDARDTATPLAAAALMGRFARRNEGLSSAGHDFLAEALGPKSKNPIRIGKLLPKSATVIHKTGTMPGTMNDVALVTTADGKHHIAIAILTKASSKSTDAEREQVIAAIAKLVYDKFAR